MSKNLDKICFRKLQLSNLKYLSLKHLEAQNCSVGFAFLLSFRCKLFDTFFNITLMSFGNPLNLLNRITHTIEGICFLHQVKVVLAVSSSLAVHCLHTIPCHPEVNIVITYSSKVNLTKRYYGRNWTIQTENIM